VGAIAKMGFRRDALKDMLKEMLIGSHMRPLTGST